MRISLGLLVCLGYLLGAFQALAAAIETSGSFYTHNTGGSQVWVRATYGGGTIWWSDTVNAGAKGGPYTGGPNYPVTVRWYSDSGYTQQLQQDTVSFNAGAPTPVDVDYPAPAGAPTNYWCVYPVNWTNTGVTYAAGQLVYVDCSNNVYAPLTFELRVVKPGGWYSQTITNWLGTNNPCGCGSMMFGDTRPTASTPDTIVSGTLYGQTPTGGTGISGGPVATGGGAVVSGSDTNRVGGYAGGGTNAASQHDIYTLGDANAQGFAEVVRAVESADGAARSNALLQLQALDMIGTNVASGVTNLESMNGFFRNFADGALSGLTNFFSGGQGLTNWFQGQTQGSLGAQWSNTVSELQDRITALRVYGDGMSGVRDALIGLESGVAPASDWGVITILRLDGTTFYSWDLKPILRADFLDGYVPGLRGWIREFLIWAAIVGLVWWLMSEFRMAILDALTPTAPADQSVMTIALGAVAKGVQGAVAAGSGLVFKKVTKAALILAGLLALPSILIGVASATYQYFGFESLYLGATGQHLVETAPSVWWKLVNLFSPWFPTIELLIIGMNWLLAKFSIDATVSFLMVYFRLGSEATS